MSAHHAETLSSEEVQTFLPIVGEQQIQRKVFQVVSRRLEAHDFGSRTPTHCRRRALWRRRGGNRRVRGHNSLSGAQGGNLPFFDTTGAVHCHRPACLVREGGLDTAANLVDSPVEEDEGESVSSNTDLPTSPEEELVRSCILPPSTMPSTRSPAMPRLLGEGQAPTTMFSTRLRSGMARRRRDHDNDMLVCLREMQALEQRYMDRSLEIQRRSLEIQESDAARQFSEREDLGDKFLQGIALLVKALRPQRDLAAEPTD